MSSSAALPNEVLTNILGYLSLRGLASASVVSQSWQNLAFSRLYHTVYLTLPSHLEQLAKRVSAESEGKSSLSIRSSLRELVFDQEYKKLGDEDYIAEENLEHLSAILPNLPRLERFSWDLSFVPRDPEVIELLQTACPNLTSVHFTIKERPDTLEFYDDAYIQLFNFENLTDFSLTAYFTPPEFDEEHLPPLLLLLRACPTLRSLTLDLRDHSASGFEWSPSALFAALDDDTSFPSLHTFRALGSANPNWLEFFAQPESNALRGFLKRHPGLHTVSLGWIWESGYYQTIDLNDMVSLFPSLKHLDAPAFICGPVVASRIADQLESLAILDEQIESSGPNIKTVAAAARSLPTLKRFALQADRVDSIEVEPLKALVCVAPVLEELEFRAPLDEPDQLIPLLKLAPNLRTLSIFPSALTAVQESLGAPGWQECIPALVEASPLLSGFNDLDYEVLWDIRRAGDGKISVIQAL